MFELSGSIGISIHDDRCYYLIWVPSESGALILDNGFIKFSDNLIPFDYLKDKINQYNLQPWFSISLRTDDVKYNFIEKHKDSFVNEWNRNCFEDEEFLSSYDSYIYAVNSGSFHINVLKSKKDWIINEVQKRNFALTNLNVGIFSALDGIKSWYDLSSVSKYSIIKLSKNRIIELLSVEQNDFSSYMCIKVMDNDFKTINSYGLKENISKNINILRDIYSGNLSETMYDQLFYYSINGGRKDVDVFSSLESNKLTLINPFRNLTFDENNYKSLSQIKSSSYSEIGNVFKGIDI